MFRLFTWTLTLYAVSGLSSSTVAVSSGPSVVTDWTEEDEELAADTSSLYSMTGSPLHSGLVQDTVREELVEVTRVTDSTGQGGEAGVKS